LPAEWSVLHAQRGTTRGIPLDAFHSLSAAAVFRLCGCIIDARSWLALQHEFIWVVVRTVFLLRS